MYLHAYVYVFIYMYIYIYICNTRVFACLSTQNVKQGKPGLFGTSRIWDAWLRDDHSDGSKRRLGIIEALQQSTGLRQRTDTT